MSNTANTAALSHTALTAMMTIPNTFENIDMPVISRDILGVMVSTGANLISDGDTNICPAPLPDAATFTVWRNKSGKLIQEVYATEKDNEACKKLLTMTGVRADQIRGLNRIELLAVRLTLSSWGRVQNTAGLKKASEARQSAAHLQIQRISDTVNVDMAQVIHAALGETGRKMTFTRLNDGRMSIQLNDGGKTGAMEYNVEAGTSDPYAKSSDYTSATKSAAVTGRAKRLAREARARQMSGGDANKFSKPDAAFISNNRVAYEAEFSKLSKPLI